jgi:gliding motility-associated-like protein
MKYYSPHFRPTKFFFRLKFLIAFLFLFTLFPGTSSGTHISGAEITYRWISGNTFELTLTLYRDCSGISAPTNPSITYSSATCHKNLNVTLTKVPGTGQEITHPCSTAVTTCSGGSSTGIQEYQYTATVTLPSQCTDWVFGYSICCRNCAITTLNFNNCSNAPATYVEATLNNVAAPTNSSPVFTNIPVTFVCIGQPFNYNHGAYDSNGDSIVYSLIPPRSASGTNVNFQPGFSATNPISSSPAVSLDPMSGDIHMYPTAVEVGVMAVLVREYRNGVLIGSVVRDMEIWTQPCSNVLPTATGINGTNSFSMTACPGVPLNFNIFSNDANAGQIVSMSWNNGIPGASFSTTGSPYPAGQLSWTPTLADARAQPYTFTVTVQDNNCPSFGFQTYSYSITVPALAVTATSTNSTCSYPGTGTAAATVSGTAPFTYSWNPGGSASSAIGSLAPGAYTVTVTGAGGCTATAVAYVGAPPDIITGVTGTTHVSCTGAANGSATVYATGGTPPYTYNWSPAGGHAASASNLTAGNYTVTITDAVSCSTTIPVSITQPTPLSAQMNSLTGVLCNGGNTGSAAVNVSGGTGPYNYVWFPGGNTTASVTGLSAGSYSVLVTDAQGCTKTVSGIISQPQLLQTAVSSTPSTCGNSNGSATVSVSGGVAPYTYAWTTGETSANRSGLAAGAYGVMVQDANGCSSDATAAVSNLGGPSVSISSLTHLSCNGDHNGSASVAVNSGTPPYIYQWSPAVAAAGTAAGLAAGNYTVTVIDGNNCASAVSFTLHAPPVLNVAIVHTDPACAGTSTGNAGVTVSGGTGPYQYVWTPGGGTNAFITQVPAGTYQVLVTDNQGCTKSESVVLNPRAPLSGAVQSTTPASCYGGNNGSAAVSVAGGTGPYSYSWSPAGGNLALAAGLSSGNYSVQVTDANNCTVTIPVYVAQPTALASQVTATPVQCAGGSSGVMNLAVNGGTAPYHYSWNPSVSQGATASNLSPGNYQVTVTDANGCSVSSSGTITQPAPIYSNIIYINDVSCHGGNNGSASVSAIGGAGSYTYQWSPNGINGPTATSLSAGLYTVIITDANQCTQSSVVAINEPEAITNTIASLSHVSCPNGTNGSVTLDVSGGAGPYTYSWSPAACHAPVCNNLAAGTYQVVITDANGCTFNTSVTLQQPQALSLSVTTTPANCGSDNGSASVTVSGGTTPYSYSWSPSSYSGNTLNGLASGTYSVQVTDGNGCTSVASAAVAGNPVMTLSASTFDVACYGTATGSASVAVSSGTGPFLYTWSHDNSHAPSAASLTAGNYTVTVTDGNSCIQSVSISISEPPALTASISSGAGISCHGGNDGVLSVTAAGGTGPYQYTWNTGQHIPLINGLSAGSYSVITTDNQGCTATTQVLLNEPIAISDSSVATPATCGDSNGAASVFVSGGTTPYSYHWSPGGMTLATVNSIASGNYSVTITDANNCSRTTVVTVNNLNGPQAGIATLNSVRCHGGNDGSAAVSVASGTMPFSYTWSPGGGNLPSASNLSAGNYLVQVTDANHCITTVPVIIPEPASLHVTSTSVAATCPGSFDGEVSASVSGGTAPYQYLWSSGGLTANLNHVPEGNYQVLVTDANGCVDSSLAVVTGPVALNLSMTISDVSCAGASDGYAAVQVTGGTMPYAYYWLPAGGNTPAVNQLVAGDYTLYVSDANGCLDEAPFTIGSPTPVSLTVTGKNINCNGDHTGQAIAFASGGIAPYSYSWNDGSISQSLVDLPAGNYSVTVADRNGCLSDTHVVITEPMPLEIFPVQPDAICIGQQSVLHAQVAGGTAPYRYDWSTGSHLDSILVSPAETQSYSLTVTDANGCEVPEVSIVVPVRAPVLLMPPQHDTICEGNTITLTANATGGTGGPYDYNWSTGSTGRSVFVSPVVSTVYTVTVKDNCTLLPATAEFAIVVSPRPGVNFLPNPLVGCAPLQANLLDQSSVCPGCSYAWEFGDGSSATDKDGTHLFENPGTYTVTHTVTNAAGCSASLTVPAAVQVYPGPVSAFDVSSQSASVLNPVFSFYDQSSMAAQWQWDFGDQSGTSELENPVYHYNDTGTYVIRLVSISEFGCRDTSYKKINVRGEFAVYFPNAFTPNGDGVNDQFNPLTLGVAEFEMMIFDRWGLKIYETDDLSKPWNGSVQGSGNTCQNDVYVYRATVRDFSGERHVYIGHVSLVK